MRAGDHRNRIAWRSRAGLSDNIHHAAIAGDFDRFGFFAEKARHRVMSGRLRDATLDADLAQGGPGIRLT